MRDPTHPPDDLDRGPGEVEGGEPGRALGRLEGGLQRKDVEPAAEALFVDGLRGRSVGRWCGDDPVNPSTKSIKAGCLASYRPTMLSDKTCLPEGRGGAPAGEAQQHVRQLKPRPACWWENRSIESAAAGGRVGVRGGLVWAARTDGELHERAHGGPHALALAVGGEAAGRHHLPRRQHEDGRPEPELRQVVEGQVGLAKRQAAAAGLLAHSCRTWASPAVGLAFGVCVANDEGRARSRRGGSRQIRG